MGKKNKVKIERGKEYGVQVMKADIYTMATNEGKIKNEYEIEDRILYIKDKLKREILMNKISVKEIDDVGKVDKFPVHQRLTICLNPYYELAVAKNVKPFPVNMNNPENMKWLSHFDTYLAMHLLYFKDFNKVLPSVEDFNYTNREVIEAKEMLADYYDVENPENNALEVEQTIIYYHPKPDVVKQAEKDVFDYEVAITCKALDAHPDLEGVLSDTGFDQEKVVGYLNAIINRKEERFIEKAKHMLSLIKDQS